MYPEIINKDKRNNEPFDGSEIQILHLVAKSIAIESTYPAVGVLTKFKFKHKGAAGSRNSNKAPSQQRHSQKKSLYQPEATTKYRQDYVIS